MASEEQIGKAVRSGFGLLATLVRGLSSGSNTGVKKPCGKCEKRKQELLDRARVYRESMSNA